MDQVWVQLEAVPGLGEDLSQEDEGGQCLSSGGGGGGFLEPQGADTGNGSCQSLIARRDRGDLDQGTEWGAECRRVSRKQGGECV